LSVDKFPLAGPGLPYVGGALLLLAVALALEAWWLAVPLAVAAGLMLWFFRDPARRAQAPPGALLAPADGRIVVLGPVADEEWLPPGPWQVVSTFMSPLDVHVNRAPAEGRITAVIHRPGGYQPAMRDGARQGNERMTLHLELAGGQVIAVTQVAGILARRIECYRMVGDRLSRGERYGMIRFGSRVDLYLPLEAKVAVQKGQRVRAGVTVLGEL
jgi:phosphatidylserine decarboxylase